MCVCNQELGLIPSGMCFRELTEVTTKTGPLAGFPPLAGSSENFRVMHFISPILNTSLAVYITTHSVQFREKPSSTSKSRRINKDLTEKQIQILCWLLFVKVNVTIFFIHSV